MDSRQQIRADSATIHVLADLGSRLGITSHHYTQRCQCTPQCLPSARQPTRLHLSPVTAACQLAYSPPLKDFRGKSSHRHSANGASTPMDSEINGLRVISVDGITNHKPPSQFCPLANPHKYQIHNSNYKSTHLRKESRWNIIHSARNAWLQAEAMF